MATVQAWAERTRSYLLSGHQGLRNTLAADYTAGSGTMSFVSPLGGIVAGSRLSIGLSTFYVSSVSATSSAATVIGGQEGTADANAPAGSMVRVNPMVTDFEIFTALCEDIADLSAPDNGLFQVAGYTWPTPYDASVSAWDLAAFTGADVIDVYDVLYNYASTTSWVSLDRIGYRLSRTADTSVFPSTMALDIQLGLIPAGAGVRALLKVAFTVPTALTDNQSVTGLAPTAYDLPPIGAAIRLMAGREIKRNRTEYQGDTRRAAEVPPGAVTNSYRGLMLLRQQRVTAERGRLYDRYPPKRW